MGGEFDPNSDRNSELSSERRAWLGVVGLKGIIVGGGILGSSHGEFESSLRDNSLIEVRAALDCCAVVVREYVCAC